MMGTSFSLCQPQHEKDPGLYHPLMADFPANAGQYSGDKLLNQAYVVIIDNKAWEACETRAEAVEQIYDYFGNEIRIHPRLAFAFVECHDLDTIVAWVSVIPVDVIDELGLLYLPDIEGAVGDNHS